MGSPRNVRVTSPRSLHGSIVTNACPLDGGRSKVLVECEGGTSMLAARDAPARQDEGSCPPIVDAAAFERGDESSGVSESSLVVPVIEETRAAPTTPHHQAAG
jgi:hypothetical protein